MDEFQVIIQEYTKIDVQTIPGLAVASAIILEVLKKCFKSMVGYEELAAIALTVGGGMLLRVTGAAFVDIPAVTLVYNLTLASIATGAAYDYVVKPWFGIAKRAEERKRKLENSEQDAS